MSALRVPARLFGAHRAPASRASRPRGAVSRIPRRALPSESAAEPTDSPDAAAETDDAWRGVCDAVTIFWDLDNLRPPNGLETVWAFRMVEAAFEFADVAHVRAYARAGTVGEDARTILDAVGVTLVECPAVPEGSDAVLSTDVVNFVRGGGRLASDDSRPDILANEAARAVRESRTHGVMIATRDEGMAECVRFARASPGCVVAIVAGEFVSKAAHRPQFTRPMTADGDVGVTPGYWRVLQNVAGKGPKGPMGKSKLASAVRMAHATSSTCPPRARAWTTRTATTRACESPRRRACESPRRRSKRRRRGRRRATSSNGPWAARFRRAAPSRCGAGSPRLGPGTVGWSAGRRSGASGAGTGRDAAWTWTIDATRRGRLLPLAVFSLVSRTRDGAFSGLFRPFVSRDLSQI